MTALRRLPVAVLVAIPLGVVVVFFLLPVGGMIGRGVWPHGSFAPRGVLDVLTQTRTGTVVWFTLWSAGVATVCSVALGLPLAFCLYRLRFPGRDLLRAWAVVPFVLPTVVVGVAFSQVLGAQGPLGSWGLEGSAASIVAAMAFYNLGVVTRIVGTSWASLDVRRVQAAAALGASPSQVWRTVTLPALLPSLLASASVVFLFCATSFGVVLTMGGLRYSNLETEIYILTTQELDLRTAAALSLLQLVVLVVLLLVVGRVGRRVDPVDRVSATPRLPRRRDLPTLAVGAVAMLFTTFPVASLVVASLRSGGAWSLTNYRALGGTGGDTLVVPATTALATSLQIAVEAAILAVLLGLVVAGVVSRRPRGRLARRLARAFDGLFMLPLGVSAVTLGFGFLITLDRPPLDLRSSQSLIPIAQALVALPLVVRTVAPVWSGIDDRQRQAAASLGAGPVRRFVTVDLAVGWRPALAATGFAFAVSLGEFGATSFLARDVDPTLPVVIYRLLSRPGQLEFGMAMAACVLLAAATGGVMMLVDRLHPAVRGAS